MSKLEVDIQLKHEIIRLKLALSILRILKFSGENSLFRDSMFKCIWFSFVLLPSSWVHTGISFLPYMTATSEKFTHSNTSSMLLICLLSYLKIRLIALQAYYNSLLKRDQRKRKFPLQDHKVTLQLGVQISTMAIFKEILLIITIQPNCEFTSKNSLFGGCISQDKTILAHVYVQG